LSNRKSDSTESVVAAAAVAGSAKDDCDNTGSFADGLPCAFVDEAAAAVGCKKCKGEYVTP
jgi:hypothetical protein